MLGQILVSGLALGAVYALIATGFTVVFATKRVINFAHGEFVMLGGVLSAYLVQRGGVPLAVAVAIAIAGVCLVAVAIYLVALNSSSTDTTSQVMITLGIAIAIKGAVQVGIGKGSMFLPAFSGDGRLSLGWVSISLQAVWVLAALTVLVGALLLVLRTTWLGLSMRAVALNPYASGLMGITPRRVAAWAFAIAGLLGGAAGAFLAPIASASYDNGLFLGLKGFAAAVLGGIGSPVGAVVGGLLLGVTEAVSAGYVSSAYKDAITFSVLFLVLMFFPQGLLGGKLVQKL